MSLQTSLDQQQAIRQELDQAVASKDAKLHSKMVGAAVQSSSTYSVSQSVDSLQKTIQSHNQAIGAMKRDIKTATTGSGSSGGPAKKPKTNNDDGRKPGSWTKLKVDQSLRYCPSFDEKTHRQCGWNSSHWFGPTCPVVRANPDYKPKHWGPLHSDWTEEIAKKGVPLPELKIMYKNDIDRFRSRKRN